MSAVRFSRMGTRYSSFLFLWWRSREKIFAYILFHLFALADGTGESNSGCWGRSLGGHECQSPISAKKDKRKVLVHQETSWRIKGFFLLPQQLANLTRRNGRGVNASMGEKQIPRLLIGNVWSPCVLSLFLMVWNLPITKNKQVTMKIPLIFHERYAIICLMKDFRFGIKTMDCMEVYSRMSKG